MTSPLISAYLVSVGILLMAGGHAALMARGSGHARTNWSFAGACLAFACFQYFCARQSSAMDSDSALAAHLWVNAFSILVIPLIALGAASLDDRPRPRLLLVLFAFAALALAHNFLSPYGYRFHTLAPDRLVTLPWGEQLRVLQGQPGMMYRLTRLISLIVLVYTLSVTLKLQRMNERLTSLLLYFGLAIMLVTLALSSMTDSGVLALPYFGGFGFVFMAGAFSLLMRREMLARELQEKRIARALFKETQERRLADARAEQILHHDPLTGLPNRAGFNLQLEQSLEQNRQQGSTLALLLIDIDHLGAVKGTHGLATSDQLMLQASQRLQERIRVSDLLARTRSDGFALIATHIKSEAGVNVLCGKLGRLFEEAFMVDGQAFRLSVSTGLALHPADATTASELLAAAELALHEARHAGSGQLRIFRPDLKESLRTRIDLQAALREALAREEFFLCYQPQVCASTGCTLAMEALLRWQHPHYGLVSPLQFIPLAEASGQIVDIGAWVIETACAQLAAWQAAGHTGLRMAINLSATQLLNPSLAAQVLASLRRNGLQAQDLELEITESVLIQDQEQTVQRLAALRELGLRLSIDDFGTGYSSLSYLRVLPVQAFKLDRSFVDGLGKDETSLEICASAIRLAQNLNLDIVAEGVETQAQAEWLRTLGCPIFQGYLFARPLTAEAASAHLRKPAPTTPGAARTDLRQAPAPS